MTEEQAVKMANSQIKMIAEIAMQWYYAGADDKGGVYTIFSTYVHGIAESNSLIEEHDINGILVCNLESRLSFLKMLNSMRLGREKYDLIDQIENFYNRSIDMIFYSDYYKKTKKRK